MSGSILDETGLDELRKAGWSWRTSSNGVFLIDPSTGKCYRLHVVDGNLTMTEVDEE